MSESERVLTAAFGGDWEFRLAAAGIVGGETAADEDLAQVLELAHQLHPDLDEVGLDKVGDAWAEWWCAGGLEHDAPEDDD